MSIYTKKGDKGVTSLFSSNKEKSVRVSKESLRVETIGSIDEVNSFLGVALSYCKDNAAKKFIQNIQKDLFTIGSILAGAKLPFTSLKTKKLEGKIDRLEEKLPEIRNFILVSGTKFATHLQYARAITRRAERMVTRLSKSEVVSKDIITYMNRLSDTLFMLARDANFEKEIDELHWITKKKS